MEASSFTTNLIVGFQSGWEAGEPWLFLIAASAAFSVAFTIERFLRLFMQYNVDGRSFWHEIRQKILANDISGAINYCNGAGQAALPRVLKSGLQRAARNETQIQNAIDATSLEMIPRLERRLPYLALIANIATLLGLLGTIAGLIISFKALSAEGNPAMRQEILSQGIATAMNATALGLMVAISTMIFHSVLSNKATRILEEIDEFGVKLMDLLSARKSGE